MTILAIDPGDKQSAYCFIDSEDLRPLRFAKAENAEVLLVLQLEKYDLVSVWQAMACRLDAMFLKPANGWGDSRKQHRSQWTTYTARMKNSISAMTAGPRMPISAAH